MEFFKLSEFDQPGLPGSGEKMDVEFLNNIDQLRRLCNFPITISSGYRSPEYNTKIAETGLNGPHTTGKAVDILIRGAQAHKLLSMAFKMGVFTGIGISQKGFSHFIHLDCLTEGEGFPRPMIWSY